MTSNVFLLCLSLGYAFGNPFSDEGACDPATRPRVIEANNVMFWSPNFRESNYPPNTLCEWVLRAPAGLDSGVEIRFGDFDVQTCNNCGCDYVEAFDGSDDSGESLGRKCGAATTPFFSFGNEVFLRFESNDDGVEGERENVNKQKSITYLKVIRQENTPWPNLKHTDSC
ncbi:hypothetical protein CAPTEDRAFT_193921 [Capitella teleta]|uniref:CUB domain-containing protein n=1 Tax=Capitella teleta TaxID=283909 RepID=R7UYU9_CAPTE|nr:hypothetical protein CAPTEDRAFT_193921 [Capitella teleta]|eukprot:ELU11509.1 hypothetical protein CAPTEDRAFT_193921 [Capitella teleta]